jgi:hypothetical protein
LNELGFILNAISEREKLRVLCEGVINIVGMKSLVNKPNLVEEFKAAEIYIDVCIKNFNSASVKDFAKINSLAY